MALQEMETARLRSIMFYNSDDDSHGGSPDTMAKPINDDDDDDEAPKWFKQLNSVNPLVSKQWGSCQAMCYLGRSQKDHFWQGLFFLMSMSLYYSSND